MTRILCVIREIRVRQIISSVSQVSHRSFFVYTQIFIFLTRRAQIARRARAYAVLTIQNVFFTHFIRTARGICDPHSLRNPWIDFSPFGRRSSILRETNYLQRITGISQKFFWLHADIYISHAESTDYTESTSIRCACYPECFLHTFHPHGAGKLVTRILCVIREIRLRQIISSVSRVSREIFKFLRRYFIFHAESKIDARRG